MDKIKIISHDETIIEVLDKKWNKYLIPRINILKAKIIIQKESKNLDDLIEIEDKDNKIIKILCSIINEIDENNILYHWLLVPDITKNYILVKKEHLLSLKMLSEEIEILDYYGKKKKIIPGKICRIAKKYHITEGYGTDNILFKIKDVNNNIFFVSKPILKFAKKKRILNDESLTIEITDKMNNKINVPFENIRDFEDYNPYNEYCEIEDINKTKIIVKKMDLQDLKEICDKNLIKESQIQEINDYKFNIYNINPQNQYWKLFPDKYFYLEKDNTRYEYCSIKDINNNNIQIKTTLIEYYLNENLNDLALEEEIFDINFTSVIFNPYEVIKNIIMNYNDIIGKEHFICLVTQSGTKHLIKINLINKTLKICKNNDLNTIISIKDNDNNKIETTLKKIKEINLKDNNNIYISLEDINLKIVYINKQLIIDTINKFINNECNIEEELEFIDYLNQRKFINIKNINIKNSKLKKNY